MGIANEFKKLMMVVEADMPKYIMKNGKKVLLKGKNIFGGLGVSTADKPAVGVGKAVEVTRGAAVRGKAAVADKAKAAWQLAQKHPVAAAGIGLTAAGVTAAALARKRKRAQEAYNLGGNNMFKDTLEDVITERFLTEKISSDKYIKLMEKIEVMSEGRALDILQEISWAGIKGGIKGGYEAAKAGAGKVAMKTKAGAGHATYQAKRLSGVNKLKELNKFIKGSEEHYARLKELHASNPKKYTVDDLTAFKNSVSKAKKMRAAIIAGQGAAGAGAVTGAAVGGKAIYDKNKK